MKKKYVILLALIIILLVAVIPAQATRPADAEGIWGYTAIPVGIKEAGCNTFMYTYDEGSWSGTFEGLSTEDGVVVMHCSGKVSFNGTMVFDGVVHGESGPRSGTMMMSVTGQCCDENGWDGQWVILNGTEGLATLRGQGTWSGPGAGGPNVYGEVAYEGNIHFEGDE